MSKPSAISHQPLAGVSLVEILVVIGIFAIVGTLVARSVVLTLRGTAKSEASVRVRENLDYALAVIERQIRSADQIITSCPASGIDEIIYNDYDGNQTSFKCYTSPPNSAASSRIASGSARLTSEEVIITVCSFTCTAGTSEIPTAVTINITGKDATTTGVEGAAVTVSTTIIHRNF